ncbi:hypothetical protein SAMN02745150_00645 [Brevinema andersonii]|uniref:Uncharacterized protein n=1 Tax=Brevinema andersonii TaxID=34097 RepID=A0A1I1DMJ7_BREAD|nr:hypothetical protein [Brevinema andersonii]SFB75666.1 hypothetical protein SAMN02745150_00645 [Brevinema andersonii]
MNQVVNVFFDAIFSQNIVVSQMLGLVMVVLCVYSFSEILWVSIRFFLLFFICSFSILIFQDFFSPIFLLPFFVGFMMLLSIFLDIILPQSYTDHSIVGIIKKGDPLVLLSSVNLLGLDMSIPLSFIYALGISIGLIFFLILMTSITISFSLDRYSWKFATAWKLLILSVFSLVFLLIP